MIVRCFTLIILAISTVTRISIFIFAAIGGGMEIIMLYKKNKEHFLSDELFRSPTSEYRGTPFWSWNCELDRDELLRQIDCLREMGFGGFHMHSRTGMATPYLSDEFLGLIDACVEKAKENDMLAWLYDEDRWPSGSAGGLITRNAPELRQRYMTASTELPDGILDKDTAIKNGTSYLLGAFDIVRNAIGEMTSYVKVSPDAPISDGAVRWYFVCRCVTASAWFNNSYYIDTLNPNAASEFIKLTYEAYKEHVGADFGEAVPAIFTDEPQFVSKRPLPFSVGIDGNSQATFPWTPKFPEVFSKRYGYDITDKLPEIIFELRDGAVSEARYHFHDNISEMFTKGFNDLCGDWCDKNGIYFTGHLMEEPTLESQTHAVGDAMRCYRKMQLPGIDMLCDRVELTTAKQTQSAVHQYGREGMTSELYGVTNWDFDFRGHKFQGDWQAALGVTVRVPHLSWVSMQGDAKRDYPASINYQSPWYREYGYVEDHFARVNTAITRGKPVVKVAVVHPIESYWLHFGPNDLTANAKAQLEENFSNITSWLLSGLIDFDYICESTLPEQYKESEHGITVGEMTYDAVIVPACETLRRTTVDILGSFADRGGKLIFVGDAPKYINAVPHDDAKTLYEKGKHISFSRTAVLNSLSDVRNISIKNANGTDTDNLIYALRRDNECDWLFLAHLKKNNCLNVSHPQHISIRIKGEFTPVLYDTLSGNIERIPYTYNNGCTVIQRTLFAYDSLLLRLDRDATECTVKSDNNNHKRKFIDSIDYRDPVDFELSEPNVLLLDVARFAADDLPYSDYEEEILRADNKARRSVGMGNRIHRPAQPWTIEKKACEHKIRLLYTVLSEIEYDRALLATETPDAAEIKWNGISVDNSSVGYFTDRSIKTLPIPKINVGKNTLEFTLPLGDRTATEWCYILGNFGVKIEGTKKTIIAAPDKLGFGSVTTAGLPFYSGNIDYKLRFTSPGANAVIRIGNYRGAAVKVSFDGGESRIVAYEPYTLDLGEVSEGEHELTVTLLGTRHNSFGALHDTDYGNDWYGPDKWRTNGDAWCYEYKLHEMGMLTSPVIYFYE